MSFLSYIDALFSSNEPLRQSFGWGTVDFASHQIWAFFITFIVIFGLRNPKLTKPVAIMAFVAIIALLTRGIALNQNEAELVDCNIVPKGAAAIGARPATVYKLSGCGETMQVIEQKDDWESKLSGLSHLILRSDDALTGYLKESGWRVISSSRTSRTFVRGFGESDIRYDLLTAEKQS